MVDCDITLLHSCDLLLVKPYQFEKSAQYDGMFNTYRLHKDGEGYQFTSAAPQSEWQAIKEVSHQIHNCKYCTGAFLPILLQPSAQVSDFSREVPLQASCLQVMSHPTSISTANAATLKYR